MASSVFRLLAPATITKSVAGPIFNVNLLGSRRTIKRGYYVCFTQASKKLNKVDLPCDVMRF